ncbi:Serpentine Receptor, class H [Caenorhabditis elegans]|uniref:Serpentine Receptor, class H n=1 Tax=Caenorhabditis elegans TaxID=6239 RepID=Q9BI94_CAEEL|nr:Serpentine Receptor, class H [Caenorhabditis elegans]CCD69664.2 Serpentine Receptor, class H [Caenorhabditis elegans]|eukprot:NP_001343658.1 Uncharacterized protein CELE_F18E3.10 [Caenorhabditis elegans]
MQKNNIMLLHVSCSIMDIFITSGFGFSIWIPSPAGFPVELMSYIGVNSVIQAYITLSSGLAAIFSYVALFESRYNNLVRHDKSEFTRFLRALFYLTNIVFLQGCMIFIFWHMPTQKEGRMNVKKDHPCIPLSYVENPNFLHLNSPTSDTVLVTVFLMVSMINVLFIQLIYYLSYTAYYLFSGTRTVSVSTRKFQTKFFTASLLQMAIPSVSFALPIMAYMTLWANAYYDQSKFIHNAISQVICPSGIS